MNRRQRQLRAAIRDRKVSAFARRVDRLEALLERLGSQIETSGPFFKHQSGTFGGMSTPWSEGDIMEKLQAIASTCAADDGPGAA